MMERLAYTRRSAPICADLPVLGTPEKISTPISVGFVLPRAIGKLVNLGTRSDRQRAHERRVKRAGALSSESSERKGGQDRMRVVIVGDFNRRRPQDALTHRDRTRMERESSRDARLDLSFQKIPVRFLASRPRHESVPDRSPID